MLQYIHHQLTMHLQYLIKIKNIFNEIKFLWPHFHISEVVFNNNDKAIRRLSNIYLK